MRFTFTLVIFLLVKSLGWSQTILFQDTFEEDKNKITFAFNCKKIKTKAN